MRPRHLVSRARVVRPSPSPTIFTGTPLSAPAHDAALWPSRPAWSARFRDVHHSEILLGKPVLTLKGVRTSRPAPRAWRLDHSASPCRLVLRPVLVCRRPAVSTSRHRSTSCSIPAIDRRYARWPVPRPRCRLRSARRPLCPLSPAGRAAARKVRRPRSAPCFRHQHPASLPTWCLGRCVDPRRREPPPEYSIAPWHRRSRGVDELDQLGAGWPWPEPVDTPPPGAGAQRRHQLVSAHSQVGGIRTSSNSSQAPVDPVPAEQLSSPRLRVS